MNSNYNTRQVKASQIARFLKKKLIGADVLIHKPVALAHFENYTVSFLQGNYHNKATEKKINSYTKSLVICDSGYEKNLKSSVIVSQLPRYDFSRAVEYFFNCLKPRISIGKNFIKRKYVVIGGVGFGFRINHKGIQERFTHIGGVKIGDNVEIGSFSTIDRGALVDTIIGSNVKIDSHVHVGHHCHVGDGTSLVAGTVLGGGSVIGRNCFIGLNVCVKEHITIGDNVLIGMGSVVVNDIPSNVVVVGNPAKIIRKNTNNIYRI